MMTEDLKEKNTTAGLVCSHHHLYSTLARGMPAPVSSPKNFEEILKMVWWRLDRALDLESIKWSAMLGALEAVERGCTAIVDHHESPEAIEGSLSVIAEACETVGVRVLCSYGVTDRHGSEGAQKGLEENRRFLEEGGQGMVGLHASFTCEDETIETAAEIANSFGVGVHVHVAEGSVDSDASIRLRELSRDNWLIVHGVHLEDDHGLKGILIHNPRSNMNNSVGYANPVRFSNNVALGTDGIGADMLEEFRLAYARHRESDVSASPETAWQWLQNGYQIVPEAKDDQVIWNYENMDPWDLAFTTGVNPVKVTVGEETIWSDGNLTRVDAAEIRAKAAEQAKKVHSRLAKIV
ncbi:MAG: amidohydrolase family protein [Actinomycetota bacterium]|nr:amidohydrolase family protein [Actinomycetota bacterium]